MDTFAAAMQWLSLGSRVLTVGTTAWDQIKGVLAANGVAGDLSELDRVIADADRRRLIAEREAQG